MNAKTIAALLAISTTMAAAATAQTVNDLLKDHAVLNSELDRCNQLGMASSSDARCQTARAAEQQRFFGGGVGYTTKPINIFPDHQDIDPQPNSQKPGRSSTSGPPHG